MWEKRNQGTAVALGLITSMLRSQRIQSLPLEKLELSSHAFCGVLTTALDRYEEIKLVTEVGIYSPLHF